MKTRIMIQNRLTHLYLGESGAWTAHPDEALTFWDTSDGLLFCRRHHLAQVFLVMKFEDERYDIKFDVDQPNFFFPGQEPEPSLQAEQAGPLHRAEGGRLDLDPSPVSRTRPPYPYE